MHQITLINNKLLLKQFDFKTTKMDFKKQKKKLFTICEHNKLFTANFTKKI